MTTTRTLRAKNPGDLLAMVPYLLGFHPEDSVVLLTLGEGPDRFHARVDLPSDVSEIPDVVSMLSGVVERHQIERVVVVTYSDDQCVSLEVSGALREALEAGGRLCGRGNPRRRGSVVFPDRLPRLLLSGRGDPV